MKMKQKYEIMTIFSSQITDTEVKKHISDIKSRLGDEIVYEEIWGLRAFAYPIKKQEKGNYAIWNFMMEPEDVKDLEESFKHYPDLLRYLILTVPEDYKPITLAEIDAGIEKLHEEKAEKRAGGGRGKKPEKKVEKPTPAKLEAKIDEAVKEAPKTEAKEETKEEAVAPVVEESVRSTTADKAGEPTVEAPAPAEEATPEPAPVVEEAKEETKEKKKAKTLDEKLDDILSDADLNL